MSESELELELELELGGLAVVGGRPNSSPSSLIALFRTCLVTARMGALAGGAGTWGSGVAAGVMRKLRVLVTAGSGVVRGVRW